MVAAAPRASCASLQPVPPALRIFDAGMGDATVLSRLMSSAHRTSRPCRCWRGEGDQPRRRAARAREDAGPLPRASAYGAGDHEPELRRSAIGLASRPAPARQLAHGGDCEAHSPTSTSSRSKRSVRCSRRPGRRGRIRRRGIPMVVRPIGARDLPRGPRVPADHVIPRPEGRAGALRLHPRVAAVARAHVGAVQGAEGAGAAGAQPARRPAAHGAVLRHDPGVEIVQRSGRTRTRSG
jgi:hypothetical protein